LYKRLTDVGRPPMDVLGTNPEQLRGGHAADRLSIVGSPGRDRDDPQRRRRRTSDRP